MNAEQLRPKLARLFAEHKVKVNIDRAVKETIIMLQHARGLPDAGMTETRRTAETNRRIENLRRALADVTPEVRDALKKPAGKWCVLDTPFIVAQAKPTERRHTLPFTGPYLIPQSVDKTLENLLSWTNAALSVTATKRRGAPLTVQLFTALAIRAFKRIAPRAEISASDKGLFAHYLRLCCAAHDPNFDAGVNLKRRISSALRWLSERERK